MTALYFLPHFSVYCAECVLSGEMLHEDKISSFIYFLCLMEHIK